MKKNCFGLRRAIPLPTITALAAMLFNVSVASAQPSIGAAGNFAALATTTVTNTGPSLITGDVGVTPGTSITGFPPGILVAGMLHSNDLVAARAYAAAFVANVEINGMDCPSGNNLTGRDLGAAGVGPLPSGVYCFESSAQLTGTLLLTGPGPWTFKIGSTLTTATDSAVIVTGPPSACSGSNVFWQVGSSATLGTRTGFTGNILAAISITVNAGTRVSGSLLALNGAVTLDNNVVNACGAGPVVPPDDDDDDCKEHGDKCKCKCKCTHHHGNHDGDHRGGHDGDHRDCDHDDHHGKKDYDKKDDKKDQKKEHDKYDKAKDAKNKDGKGKKG